MATTRSARLLTAALLALTAGACDDITGLDDSIIIENESGVTITHVYIRDCDATDWGSDRLGSDEVISPNDSRGFDEGEGCYDLRAVFLAGGAIEEHNVELTGDEQFFWTIDSPSGTIIVDNNATTSVHFLYLARCTDATWGPDVLGDGATIAPGREHDINVLTGCWDLRAEFSDESFAEEFGIDIVDGEQFTWELID